MLQFFSRDLTASMGVPDADTQFNTEFRNATSTPINIGNLHATYGSAVPPGGRAQVISLSPFTLIRVSGEGVSGTDNLPAQPDFQGMSPSEWPPRRRFEGQMYTPYKR